MNVSSYDKNKYDRQIRLFGKEVQDKLNNLSVSVLSEKDDTFVSGEIMKNLVLLGVNKIYADDNTLKSFTRLVPNTIEGINPKINMLDKPEGIIFVVDKLHSVPEVVNFYISSESLEFDNKEIIKNAAFCKDESHYIKECLLGGIVIQEFIKMLQNQTYQTKFSLSKLLN
ncbi:ubiquitin-like modifier-activating enzyme [Vairimorpha necatrix]|uniref:Ubiquitin-like modifier-activating enzyme n=1 Tax=Vairimorpha necatrix TaxID=6039 RepID=A0AAX4J9N9_9MICR